MPKKIKTPETTGHEWDGIKEYNNPLPLWWLWIFALSVVFAIGYAIYFPAVPPLGQKAISYSGWTQYKMLEDEVSTGMKVRAPYEEKLKGLPLQAIQSNPDLHTYAVAAGKSAYALHCAQCHGAGGGGAKGYPNHLDDEWIWGGSLDDIIYTIRHGIRDTTDPETRDMGAMMAYGEDGLLDADQIKDVVYYLKILANPHVPGNEATERGKVVFAENCASCHMEDGSGNRELGAPPLDNAIWLYGGDTKTLFETLNKGRAGMMPAYGHRLTEEEIRKLALYVHSLGGGE